MVNLLNQQKLVKEREYIALRKAFDARFASQKLMSYTRVTFPNYVSNWHHEAICTKIDDLIVGKIKRLMIFVPPRNGKSELVSVRAPSFALGRDPDEQIIMASYAADLANKHNRQAQRVMDTQEFKSLFPNTKIASEDVKQGSYGRYARTSELVEVIGKRGYLRSAGVGGAITGTGFTLGVIDDPFKNRQEADSKVTRDMVWNWYTSTFYTRKEKDARILVTMTRWHEDDLAGRLLKQMEKGGEFAEEWIVIELPALKVGLPNKYDPRQPNEPLWPWKYPYEELMRMQSTMGSRDWASLQQQTPMVEGGNIVQRRWWKFYKQPPAKLDEVVQSWDLTFKEAGSSWVVGQVWGRKGSDKYLLDQFRAKVGFVETVSAIKTMKLKWPEAHRVYIEDKANGPAVIDSLSKQISGVIAVKPEGSKESRLHAVSAQIESGNVYLPEGALWVHDYIEEFSAFPNGADDDQVDATTQALRKLDISGIERLEKLLTF